MKTLHMIAAASFSLMLLNGCSKTEVVPGQTLQSTQVTQKATESDRSSVAVPTQPKVDVRVSQPAQPAVTKTETTVVKQPQQTTVVTAPSN
jgi:PBP1b-binding outer membrane lipoprotein LpoB